MNKITQIRLLITLFILSINLLVFSQNHQPVLGFGTSQYNYVDIGNPSSDLVVKGQKDPQGNYYAFGYTYNSSLNTTIFSITKFLNNGNIDLSFGQNGTFSLNVATYGQMTINDIDFQSDGKIIFVGEMYKSSTLRDAIIGRLLSNGSLDISFNSIGYRIFNNTSFNDNFFSIEIQTDDKLVVCGTTSQNFYSDYRGIVIRYLNNGNIDNSFGIGGIYKESITSTFYKLKILNDNSILVDGQSGVNGKIKKLNTNGNIINSFGVSGTFTYYNTSIGVSLGDFEILQDESIVGIAFIKNSGGAGNDSSVVFKIDSNGQLINSFGNSGKCKLAIGSYSLNATDILINSNQEYIICGFNVSNITGDYSAFECEISTNGFLDTTINDNGYFNYNLNSYFDKFLSVFEDGSDLVIIGLGEDNEQNFPGDILITKLRLCNLSAQIERNCGTLSVINPDIGTIEWVNQSTNQLIFNENSVNYSPTNNGNYSAILNLNGCYDTTEYVEILNASDYNHLLTIEECGPTLVNGQLYDSTGVYTQVYQNQAGCDSTLIINLTVNPSFTNNLAITACDSILINNYSYSNSGIYLQNLNTVNGCDSLVEINLTVNYSFVNEFYIEECGPTLVNGQLYDSTGVYTQVYQNQAGCDSTLTINLTVNPSFTNNLAITACDSILINNYSYSNSGIYLQNLNTVNGCDSLVEINLTVNNSFVNEFYIETCDSFNFFGTEIYESGNYVYISSSIYGCDSIQNLNLSILQDTDSLLHVTALDSISINEQTYYNSGQYEQILTNSFGCDSILHIIVDLQYSQLENLELSSLNIYPNPSNSLIYIELPDLKPENIQVIDALNRLQNIDVNLDNKRIKLEMKNLSPGVYYICFTNLDLPNYKVVLN